MIRRIAATLVARVVSPPMAEALAAGVAATSRYKLRTSLSVLGVTLGVAAVVAMVAVGEGARDQALSQAAQLGLRNVVVRSSDETPVGPSRSRGLTAADVGRIRSLEPAVAMTSPLVQRLASAVGPLAREQVTVLAVEPSFFDILGLSAPAGRLFTVLDHHRASRRTVLGHDLARTLFGHRDPAGRFITLDGIPFEVVGVLASRRALGGRLGTMSPRTFERSVLVPWTTYVTHGSVQDAAAPVDEIWVRTREGVDPGRVGLAVDRALAASRMDGRDFEIIVPRELIAQQLRLRGTFDVVVGAIAGVTLLVGGLGVMNVLLTAVIERTAEVGLRRCAGATRRAIRSQFLAEAVMICGLGGGAGLVVGAAVAMAISTFGQWPTVLSVRAAAAAILVSAGVGLASGAYPARRAAAMNPIDAVRHE